MTDLQFLNRLKHQLLNFEQVLISNDVEKIDAATNEIEHFLQTNQLNPPERSGESTRILAAEVQELMQRCQVLIRQGLHISNVMLQTILNQQPTMSDNYKMSDVGQDVPSRHSSQRIFDARV